MRDYVNVDSQPLENPDVVLDIGRDAWPWPDNSVDQVRASHILEHIPRGEPFFHCLKEMYRVCQPGATVDVILPHPRHDLFLNDPTHMQALTPGTFTMFSKRLVEEHLAKGCQLTPFYKYLGIDFDMRKIGYNFDPDVDQDDPELAWKVKHLNNIVIEWRTVLTVVK